MRDNLFNANIDIADFRFDKEVVEVFDDMVRRSVPGYDSMIQMIGLIARMYGQDNTNYYDLGSSTGAISLAIALNNKHQKNTFFAIDNSEEMVSKCKQNLESKIDNLQATCADINQIHIENASIVVLNLTLQFIDVKDRSNLIKKIYEGLNPGGVLIISEKIHFEDKETQDQITNLHIDFKKENGYSELEIANKRQAIENVLITDTKAIHIERLKDSGFKDTSCFFQCLNFVSFLSVK
ncbi:carboxy-S-adenosyl-L-methionine synthase CmoA [Candidatus Thioglobus sp.]|jgi:tRNA (cmo5U34)-methyltransferase|uniref:Carboxy-S-adenosyl-L-methionine synthase n=1 Tax=Candidatus Pseudothioglobus singularis PS1 TaxID=1125411 RepID=A0A0M3T288_9GAMM|nr:carboxy-S-adenosyl-L-methionine synthase CmoA [Candidatus Pseudothioglobus singularis]MDA9642392.1 carboxy-S-adenosyl-L-methionine synthase CmoA [Candidatus Thioglobus sp.]ALE02345.1 tRNA methyltransferase [Candidatus Pseudothioglobus singularis PS1]ANQ66998.1 tRNA methyltransferase [Candidatus Pseudothioglobus singularis]MDA8755779.1 carboxy-S-adenosyl-L-methionine synthase CmoA [Candidatus Pseudothioglobus singularis]MDA8854580.1 carboxy-S-adenosyl-L-methionine synthase CmoA [Candidatus P|tara:strand:- start:1039 stop:1752 length:714 start_codon:yes stop_codon:yes gene_type:complete